MNKTQIEVNGMLRYIEQEMLSWDHRLDKETLELMLILYRKIVTYRLDGVLP